jgi:predicted RNA-binding Zn ribbon-like protein
MVLGDGRVVDLLREEQGLERWLEAEQERLGECGFAAGHLEGICALRDHVHRLLTALVEETELPPEAIAAVNRASAQRPVVPQLGLAAGALTATERAGSASPIDQLLGQLAQATIALIAEQESGPLRVCHAPSCGMFFRGQRRWCCEACGNRARAARHYGRKRGRARDIS